MQSRNAIDYQSDKTPPSPDESSRVLTKKWDGRSTLTVEEAGEILGLSRCSAYAAANKGDLPVIRVGRRWIVPRHALERMLESAGRQP